LNTYTLNINNKDYLVGGPGDLLSSPPSARGFSLGLYEPGTDEYVTIFKAVEENGYGFIIYSDESNKLILKGPLGSDHKETIYNRNEQLKNIRNEKYSDQNDLIFLRKTCLSGRSWLVNIEDVNYYFVAIWNSYITQDQYDLLIQYLTKFPKGRTYIQMGLLGTGPQSEFKLFSNFVPKFFVNKTKLSKKEKDFVQTAHQRIMDLPPTYAKKLQQLRRMIENNTYTDDHRAYENYKKYALKMIVKLENTKNIGKSKIPVKDIVTKSSVQTILIGIGNKYPNIRKKLESLMDYSFTHSDLLKLHNKGRIDAKIWQDTSLDGVIDEKTNKITHGQWMDNMSTGFGKKDHPINGDTKHLHPLKVKLEKSDVVTDELDESYDVKKYWVTPQGKIVDAGNSHEDWIKNNDRPLMGTTLVDTYENAVAKGYVRVIYDIGSGFLTLSNLPNYDFSMSKINRSVKQAIEDFVVNKEIRLVATGKGKLIKDFQFSFAEQLELAEQILNSKKLEEGWKDWVAAGAIGLGALSGSPTLTAKQSVKPAITQQSSKLKSSESSLLNKKTSDYIGQWEGKRNTMYLDTEKKPTIGIGHYLTNTQQDRDLFNTLFGNDVNYDLILKGKQKLTDDQIEKLFNVDVKVKEKLASKKISNFSSFPQYVKNAIINAFYRGDMGPKTIRLMNNGDWNAAAKEYLNHQNARSGPEQIQRRMKTNALAFVQYAKNKNEYFGFNYYF